MYDFIAPTAKNDWISRDRSLTAWENYWERVSFFVATA